MCLVVSDTVDTCVLANVAERLFCLSSFTYHDLIDGLQTPEMLLMINKAFKCLASKYMTVSDNYMLSYVSLLLETSLSCLFFHSSPSTYNAIDAVLRGITSVKLPPNIPPPPWVPYACLLMYNGIVVCNQLPSRLSSEIELSLLIGDLDNVNNNATPEIRTVYSLDIDNVGTPCRRETKLCVLRDGLWCLVAAYHQLHQHADSHPDPYYYHGIVLGYNNLKSLGLLRCIQHEYDACGQGVVVSERSVNVKQTIRCYNRLSLMTVVHAKCDGNLIIPLTPDMIDIDLQDISRCIVRTINGMNDMCGDGGSVSVRLSGYYPLTLSCISHGDVGTVYICHKSDDDIAADELSHMFLAGICNK